MRHHRSVAPHVPGPLEAEPIPQVPVASGDGKTLRRRRSNKGRCSKKSSDSPSATSSSLTNETTRITKASSSQADPESTTTPKSTPKADPSTTKKDTKPSSTTSSAPKPSSGSGSNLPSFLKGTQTGQGTFYGTGLGACGITNKDTDYIAAVSHLLFDAFPGYNGANPNSNPLCNKKVTARYKGKSVTVALTDRCAACKVTDLDFSPAAFNKIADPALGRISGMTWDWLDL